MGSRFVLDDADAVTVAGPPRSRFVLDDPAALILVPAEGAPRPDADKVSESRRGGGGSLPFLPRKLVSG